MPELITLNNIESDAVDSLIALATNNSTLDGTTTLSTIAEKTSLPAATVDPEVEYLIVAGGASGGFQGGGGGAGGLLQGSMSITLGSTYSFLVGGGAAAITSNATRGSNGGNSSGLGMTAIGGGGGGTNSGSTNATRHGVAGGSGGGASAQNAPGTGGAGTAGQGNAGGTATYWTPDTRRSRGGGGAGAAGVSGTGSALGTGGSGLTSSITGLAYAGGGGGNNGMDTGRATGGSGVGGAGGGNTVTGFPPTSAGANSIGGNGIVNTGGGGGGGVPSGAGGSGVVILKYPNTYDLTIDAGLTSTTDTSVAGYKITTFTAGAGNVQVIASVVLFDISQSSTFVHDTATGNFTANFINVPTTNDRTVSAALIIPQGATGYLPTAIHIDGVSQTFVWEDDVVPEPSINSIDVVSFILLRSGGAWTVLASLIKFGLV